MRREAQNGWSQRRRSGSHCCVGRAGHATLTERSAKLRRLARPGRLGPLIECGVAVITMTEGLTSGSALAIRGRRSLTLG